MISQPPIRFQGGTAYTRIEGPENASTVVLVHGVGLDQSLWQSWLNRLSSELGLVAYDLLGHGQSENPAGQRCLQDFVEQIDELVKSISLHRFILVGFSLGALISLAYASKRSTLTHLVLLHPVYRRNQEQADQVQERLNIAKQQGPDIYIETALERWFSESYRNSHPEIMDGLRATFNTNGAGYLNAYRLFADVDREMCDYNLGRIECPVLVITGSNDTGSAPSMSEQLAQDLPRARYVINPGHRHMAPVEFADTLCGQFRKFLTEHP